MTKHSVSRRELLASVPMLGLAAGGLPATTAAAPTGGRAAGIQLYTLRASMAQDLRKTLTAVAAIGYRSVEFAGYFDVEPATIRSLLGDLGLESPSTHMDARTLAASPGALLDTAAAVGHEYVVIPWLAPDDRRTLDDWRRWAEVFNRVGAACRERGLRLAYHNHEFEFEALSGRLPFDLLLAETDPALVDIELDFYWTAKAGHDVVSVLEQAPHRFVLAHVKDMAADGAMVDVGDGTIDFAGILAAPAAATIEHLYVEHDNPADPFRTAAIGRRALSRLLDLQRG